MGDATPLGEALDAVRHAPLEVRSEFWRNIREAITARHGEPAPQDDRERVAELREANPVTSLVYYLRFGDRVKIGVTTNLEARLRVIPHDEVLATEVGTMQDERARHAAFANLRVTGEWFRYEEPLVSHIAGLQ